MAAFKIQAVRKRDGHLVLDVTHFRPNGSAWFQESYVFQGREAHKFKTLLNDAGEPLMDNGRVAPQDPEGGWFLPEGRTWQPSTTPHFQRASILSVIRSIHRRRLQSGWPERDDRLRSRLASGLSDDSGIDALLTRHVEIRDQEFDT